jgi:hypothetical protein
MECKIVNRETVKAAQRMYLEGKTSVSSSKLAKLGISELKKIIEIGNLRFVKDAFFDSYTISLVDEDRDLDGKMIRERKDLFNRLVTLWEENKRRISFEEMKDLNIFTSRSTLVIKNFRLSSSGLFFADHYSIELIDQDKDPEGRWTDETTNVDRVLMELKSLSPAQETRAKEGALEIELFNFLRDRFHTVQRQIYIGGAKALKIDLDLADGKIGIELKLAKSLLNANEKQRFIGQMHDYTTKRYQPEGFILVVAGEAAYRSHPTIREIRDIVRGRSHFFFLCLD